MIDSQIQEWEKSVRELLTPVDAAVKEVIARQSNTQLKSDVLKYLNADIPECFENGPILYFSRHVATPSFETLRFIEVAHQYDLPVVIGQDVKDIFVSNNTLKHALGKLPIVKGIARNSDEIYENFTIVDFSKAQGVPFNQIQTKFEENIVNFHTALLREVYPSNVIISDESEWIDRNHRGNLFEHYKKALALLIVHGVMFETYLPEDYEFVETVFKPAFAEIEKEFGCRPLICELLSIAEATEKNSDAYPSIIYPLVKNKFNSN